MINRLFSASTHSLKTEIILGLIIVLAIFLRGISITDNPPALYGDELTIAYDAYSLLKTGRDQTGQEFPLTFSMGAGRPDGYVYFSIPFVSIFGPSALGVRMLSVISGVGVVVLLFFLGRMLFSPKVGLWAAFITAVSPWEIALSRGGFEAHFALFLALVGTAFFLAAQKRAWFYLVAALSFGTAIHTYPTYKLIIPLFMALLVWYTGGYKRLFAKGVKSFTATALVVIIFAFTISFWQTFTAGSESRFLDINVFSKRELKEEIIQRNNLQRNINSLPGLVATLFHNQPLEYSFIFSESYLKNFSLDFLFFHGDRNPRHNMAKMGFLYVIELVFIPLGLVSMWRRFNRRIFTFVVSWLLIAPIAATFLGETHALRNAFMIPPLVLISSLGIAHLAYFFNQKYIKIITLILFVGFLTQFLFFVERLYFLSPNEFGNFWSYPAKLAVEKAVENKEKFRYIILSDRIDNAEYAYQAYTKADPLLAISQFSTRSTLGEYKFKKFGNVYIGSLPDKGIKNFINSLEGSILYIGSIFEKEEFKVYDTIYGKDELPAFIVIEKR